MFLIVYFVLTIYNIDFIYDCTAPLRDVPCMVEPSSVVSWRRTV